MKTRIKTPISKDTGSVQDTTEKTDTIDNTTVEKEEDKIEESSTEEKSGEHESPGGEREYGSNEVGDNLVEIDGTSYTVNSDGDAVKEDGSIFMKKEEMEELEKKTEEKPKESKAEEPTDADVSVADLEKLSGITVTDETGKKIDFDFTLEGLAERENKIKEQYYHEGSSKALDEFFNDNPDLYKAFIHKREKGTLEGFTNEPVYSTFELDENNEQQLFDLIVEAEVKKGSSIERAKGIANYFKAEDKLVDEGKLAHKFLSDIEREKITRFEQDQKTARERRKQEEAKFFGTYYDESGKEVVVGGKDTIYGKIVEEGKVGNFVIPQSGVKVKVGEETKVLSRRDIFNYMSRPVNKDGHTQAQIDLANRFQDIDVLLESYLLNLTQHDVGALVERKVLEEKSKNIKRRLSTGSKTTGTSSSTTGASKDKRLKVPVRR